MYEDPRYADINAKTYPPINRADAGRFALKLIRRFGSPRDAAYRSGLDGTAVAPSRADLMRIYYRYVDRRRDDWGRTCWASTKPTRDHNKGWGRLIHDVSHIIHEFRHPKERPHGPLHVGIEREVQHYVDAQGWLIGKTIKPSLTLDQRRIDKRINLEARLKRWESKNKRALTAIRKLKRSLARLDKSASRSTDTSLDAPHAVGLIYGRSITPVD